MRACLPASRSIVGPWLPRQYAPTCSFVQTFLTSLVVCSHEVASATCAYLLFQTMQPPLSGPKVSSVAGILQSQRPPKLVDPCVDAGLPKEFPNRFYRLGCTLQAHPPLSKPRRAPGADSQQSGDLVRRGRLCLRSLACRWCQRPPPFTNFLVGCPKQPPHLPHVRRPFGLSQRHPFGLNRS